MVRTLDFTLSEVGSYWRVVCTLTAGIESGFQSSEGRIKQTSEEGIAIIQTKADDSGLNQNNRREGGINYGIGIL